MRTLFYGVLIFVYNKIMLKKNFYKWFKATLAIVSIVLIVLDFAAIIDINGTNSKWFWLNNIIFIGYILLKIGGLFLEIIFLN